MVKSLAALPTEVEWAEFKVNNKDPERIAKYISGIHVTLIEIPCAAGEPTRFESAGYIRVGSNLQPLAEYPEKEAELWRKFDKTPYEKRMAYTEASAEDVVTLLDYPGYYRKIGAPIPENRDKVLKDLKDEKFIHQNDGGSWDISNYGALMIATDLKAFDNLAKRGVRVIRYPDRSRIIRDTLDAKLIKPMDPETAPRYMKYVPFWA